MIEIPGQDKKFAQVNRSNNLGNLWSTFNIDLQSNVGRVRASNRMKINTQTSDQANLGLPVAFEFFDGRMWAICGTRIFKNTGANLTSAFAEDASSGVPTSFTVASSDMCTFNNALVATTGTNIYSKAYAGDGTGAWTSRNSGLNDLFPHMVTYFQKFDRVYITDINAIKSMDTGWSVATSGSFYLDLGTTLSGLGTISCIAAGRERIYIGVNRRSEASIFEWDGKSNQVNAEYKLSASGVMSIVIKNDIPYAIDSDGNLLKFTGSSFVAADNFPLNGQYLYSPLNTGNTDRFVHPNGMAVTDNDTILILTNNRNLYNATTTENSNENMHAGIWEYDSEIGLTHKYSMSYMPLASTSVTDHGQMRLSSVGALRFIKIGSVTTSGFSSILAGATQYTNATSTTNAIFVDAPVPTDNATYPEGQKYASFVTTWIDSPNIKESWQRVVAKYKEFASSTDRIWIKYRTREETFTEVSITWTSTTTFTTSTNLIGKEGYEVEVIQGTGSGKTAHITQVDVSGSTYTITLDETFTGATGTAKARVQNWKKLQAIVSDQLTESKIFNVGATSERIQFKCCMQITGDGELHKLAIINAAHTEYDGTPR